MLIKPNMMQFKNPNLLALPWAPFLITTNIIYHKKGNKIISKYLKVIICKEGANLNYTDKALSENRYFGYSMTNLNHNKENIPRKWFIFYKRKC